ncbi:hypothetical protein [Aquabacterium sp.]|uniref:hypothetical protein n=1 Tax=Aquabacterium sp. TaxID=1872578 RepID=UPI0037844F67
MRNRSRSDAGPIIGALLVGLLLAAAPARAEETPAPEAGSGGYEFGRGLRLGDSGFTLGGYLTGEYRRQAPMHAQLRASHASVFLWWEGLERFKVFGELDLENLLARHRDAYDNDGDADRRASLERLYLDWAVHDRVTLRVGKFLTPIGRWNLVHADPLVWTTSRPLLTQSAFPHNATGLMATGTLPADAYSVSYSFYASNGAEWAVDDRQDPFSTVRGGRLVLPVGTDWQLGASYARYQQQGSRGEPRTLTGLDLLWTHQGYELMAEWLRTSSDQPGPAVRPEPDEGYGPGSRGLARSVPTHGLYVQGVAPIAGALYAVARVEWFRDTWTTGTQRQSTLGLAWRPHPALSLKLEVQHPGSVNGPNRANTWLASACILF